MRFLVALAIFTSGLLAAERAQASIDLTLRRPQTLQPGSGGDEPGLTMGHVIPKLPVINPMIAEPIAGLVASVITIPLCLWAGDSIGQSGPFLQNAVVPPLVLLLFIPPLATTFAEWGVGRILNVDTNLQPAIYVALGLQILTFVVAAVLPVWTRDTGSIVALGIIDAILLPAGVTGTLFLQDWLKPKPPPDPNAFQASTTSTTGVTLLARKF